MTTNSNPELRGRAGTLNVLLHGTFAFVEDLEHDVYRAYIPKIESHVVRAGNWLAETELLPGEYELTTVIPGRHQPDKERNLVLLPGRNARKRKDAVWTLTLPRPKTITTLRVAPLDEGIRKFLTDTNSQKDKNKLPSNNHIGTLQIFTYDFLDDTKLRFEGQGNSDHYWEPVFTGGDYINLHVFSTEDHPDDPAHAQKAFQDMLKLLLGQEQELTEKEKKELTPSHPAGDVTGTLPPGVIAEETEDLAPRMLRMARLGRLFKQKGDTNLAWFGNDGLGSYPGGCGDGFG